MAVYNEKDKKKWTKDGRTWYYRCSYKDIYGNIKRKKSKMFKTKKEAQDNERDFLISVRTQDETNYEISFSDVYNEWLEFKKKKVKATTFYCIKNKTKKHIFNFFEKFKLHSIKINIINKWLEELNKSGIKLDSQNKIIGYMQELLNYAVENYEFDIKIKSKLQKYHIDTPYKKSTHSENNYLTYEEFKKFISVVDDNYYYLIFTFLYFTGLRIGEMIALNWNDINFKNKTVSITKSFTNKIDGDKWTIVSPKTANSIRYVDLDDNLLKLLKKHYNNEKNIIDFNNNMFVFGNIHHLSQTTLVRILNKYLKKANIKKITPHGFRHSHVSLLIHLGCDARDVANRVGDTVQMIEKTYYHMFPKKEKETITAINNLNKNF